MASIMQQLSLLRMILCICAIRIGTSIAWHSGNYNMSTGSMIFVTGKLNLSVAETKMVNYMFLGSPGNHSFELCVVPKDSSIVRINYCMLYRKKTAEVTEYQDHFFVEGMKLGQTKIYAELRRRGGRIEVLQRQLHVIVIRRQTLTDMIFHTSVASLMIIIYVNFGAVLNMTVLKEMMFHPIGPCIGLFGQFVVMPILSFIIGWAVFHDNPEMRLGLFFTGTTPGGGYSNLFTVALDGNINLSITMTTINSLVAFAAMPLWIFTLGTVIFRRGDFAIPYSKVGIMSLSLVVPLLAGFMLQIVAPEKCKAVVKWLKPISLVLIIFIMIFGFIVNSFIFSYFTAETLLASASLPWIGYAFGWCIAAFFRQSSKDSLTIAIETGIQNTGIAIFMVNFTLPQPQVYMASAVPIAHSLMMPLPLLVLFVAKKCFKVPILSDVRPPPKAQTISIMKNNQVTFEASNTSSQTVAKESGAANQAAALPKESRPKGSVVRFEDEK